MDHLEIRAIRGSLSRAAFARLLGVTSLTVLRWELAGENKEARRPRAKMIEALRRLAADGVGIAERPPEEEDDADEDASEPVAPTLPPSNGVERTLASKDEELVLPLLERLNGEGWRAAEDELFRLLSGTALSSVSRTLAALGLVQIQMFARLDARGALTALAPMLDDAERGKLPPDVTARVHVMAALLFGAPDSRFFDVGRVNVHAAKADALLSPHADDLRVLLATAQISAARFLGPHVVLRTYNTHRANLDRATSPLARFFAGGFHGLAASAQGDEETAFRYGVSCFAIVERLGMPMLMLAALADRIGRALRGSMAPGTLLEIIARARLVVESAGLPPCEPWLRVLAYQVEVLFRQGRFQEADVIATEARALAQRGAIARYALAVPLARLYTFTNRLDELEAFADSLDAECASASRALVNVHALYVRGVLASLVADFPRATELLNQVCLAPEATVGIDYLRHDAWLEYALAQVLMRDREGMLDAQRQCALQLERSPSVWFGSMFRRLEAFVLLQQGRFAEARQKVETTVATFTLLGDVAQVAFAKAALAITSQAAGAPDAPARFAAAKQELDRLGVLTPEIARRAQLLSTSAVSSVWREPTTAERLMVGIERLGVRGLSRDQFLRELGSVLGDLFPGREPLVDAQAEEGAEDSDDSLEITETGLRFGVKGSLDAEQRAALRILVTFVSSRSGLARASQEPELAIDNVLPHFIAVAPATRKLKGEVSRIARSTATILITGESGSGKEVVARAVHELSARNDKPYVVFNCASVPRELFESQLFGHRKGSFTGAVADNLGVIRAAEGGTLFLDEIGELPLDTQPKLLRFLENAEVLPIGEQKARRVDVRVVAATHRDLSRLVREGRFREDLYYRLNVVPLNVPPLRERREDVVALARVFVARLTPTGSAPPELGADAVSALKSHTWPGNVRELRNVIERAMAYAPVPPLLRADQLRIAAQA